MRILHISAECYPVAKAGGLGDVIGALPKYQRENGMEAAVIMPWYDKPFVGKHAFEKVYEGELKQGSQYFPFEVIKEKKDSLGFELFLLKIPGLVDRPEIYGYGDESDQFIAFQHAVLLWLLDVKKRPTILHCHDHHTGLIPFFVEHCAAFKKLKGTPTVFTVHNGEYQGWMPWHKAVLLPEYDNSKWGLLDWDHQINPLAAAIKCCWAYSTVSEGYLEELFYHPVLGTLFSDERKKAHGIVNGIDLDVWNPAKDPALTASYTVDTVTSGKKKNKEQLCQDFDLNFELPLVAFIGRFATEKGADLLPGWVQQVLSTKKGKISLFILGSGDPGVEDALRAQGEMYKEDLAVFVGYDEALAHRIYASADFIFMPSRVEPCGLNQLYALRYGTIPIVRAIGGLKDTVKEIGEQGGNGFLFPQPRIEACVEAVKRALSWYENDKAVHAQRKKNMKLDYSWTRSADKYKKMYDLIKR